MKETDFPVITRYEGRLVVSNTDVKDAANVYATFYFPVPNQAWDENASDMGSNDTVTHANAAVTCTDETDLVSDGWYVPIPSGIRDGFCVIKLYNNAVPAVGDTIILAKAAFISGGFAQSIGDN